MTANDLIARLGLEPLPIEGGYYRRSYTSVDQVATDPGGDKEGARPLASAIYFLLTAEPGCFSELHMLASDEIYHFYLGDPAELVVLQPGGAAERIILGPDLADGQRLQYVVPAGVWQGSRLIEGGEYALMGTTLAPGWSEQDYISADRDALISEFPEQSELITALTRQKGV